MPTNIRKYIAIGASTIILLLILNWFYNNSYTPLKPILFLEGDIYQVPYTDEMIKNFPIVLKHYHIPYKKDESGHFLIMHKHMDNTDIVLTVTGATVDSSRMQRIREQETRR